MMNWYGSSWGSTSGWWPGLMMLGWVPIVAAAVWAIARLTRTGHRSLIAPEPPRVVLDRRFIAGEIDAERYAEARRTLEGPQPDGAVVAGDTRGGTTSALALMKIS